MTRLKQQARVMEAVQADISERAWRAPADGLTGLQHARQHLAAMSPERRRKLEEEWNND